MQYFLQGLTMGLAYVAPIGLQNLFVINSALTQTRRRALITVICVIFFDISLSLASFFGIGAVMKKFEWLQMIVLLVGSLIVVWIGISLFRSQVEEIGRSKPVTSIWKTFVNAFIVTWINPQAIIDGTMMLGAFRVTLPASQSVTFVSGVGSASVIWFIALTMVISLFSRHFTTKTLRMINIICGAVIVLYGVKLFANFITLAIH